MSKRDDGKAEDETEDKAMTKKADEIEKTAKDTADETAESKATDSMSDADEVKYSVVFDDEDDSILDIDDAGDEDDSDADDDNDATDDEVEAEGDEDADTEDDGQAAKPQASKATKSATKSAKPKAKTSKAADNHATTKSKAKAQTTSATKSKTKAKPGVGDEAAGKNAEHVRETLKLRDEGDDGLSSHEDKSKAPEPATVISSKIDKAEAAEADIRLKPNPTFGFDHVTLQNRKTGRNALDNVNWSFFAGNLYLLQNADDEQRRAFLGAASGFLRLDVGQITVRSVSLNELEISEIRGHRVALLTQLHNVRGDLDALTNLTFAMSSSGRTFLKPVPVRARELLKQVGFDQATTGMPLNKLSELDQRRVAIARAISCEPTVIIADDPAGGLKPEDREVVLNLLTKLAHSRDPKYCVIVIGPMLGSAEAGTNAGSKDSKDKDSEQPTLAEAYLAAADKTYEF
ncbi:ATP-binding cassette domain-containing protein [Bifidobacterium sp. ESL0790]|uniref:ATP-binding cassette domain-containing protein n=1 Tax=Bifidobacterium sp. ESL0790 TaxID=2983233 RepID=UPI0023F841DC|nr:ATP-binding cassette domain-containing protein [Bifidobacterium sp. ESL0790]WEV72569.1 ATP-binding cassette domain-containing protein [Bifidobacterium sp. ESL0790]